MDELKNIKTLEELGNFELILMKECQNKRNEILAENRAEALSNKSFGYIKDAFESISSKLFESAKGRKLIKKYTDSFKGNTNLSSLHNLFENIRTAGKDCDVDFLLNAISSTDWKIDTKTVNEDVKKLGSILGESYKLLGKDCEELLPNEKSMLYNAVEYIAENKKSAKTLANYSAAIKIIREEIEKNESSNNIFESKSNKSLEELVKEYNDKYSTQLTEEEQNLVKSLCENKNREEVFNEYKDKCISTIKEAKEKLIKDGDVKSADKLHNIQEQVQKKIFNEITFNEDVCNFIEMNKIF